MNEITKRDSAYPEKENMEITASGVKELMMPIMQSVAKMIENNTQAMDQIVTLQQAMNDHIKALEEQIRLNMPMTNKQARCVNMAIRLRAEELLGKYGVSNDKKAVVKLCGSIRKCVLLRFGASGLRDIPKCEYSVAIHLVSIWNDMLLTRDIAKEARQRAGEASESARSSSVADASSRETGEAH